mgnify:CR=1 FL=1
MLRSLVGSEMCIRYRNMQLLLLDANGSVIDSLLVPGLIAAGVLDGNNWVCLLYTSDAADDLLCVDLGGRRIIKKKS